MVMICNILNCNWVATRWQ